MPNEPWKILGSEAYPISIKNRNSLGEDSSVETTSFHEIFSSQKEILIELKSLFGTSSIRDFVTSISGGETINFLPEIKLSTSASAQSYISIESAEYAKYIPGNESSVFIGARFVQLPTGSQVYRWGLFDSSNGFYFGKDVTGSFIGVRNSGSDSIVRQSQWNVDKLDGTGPSAYNFNSFSSSGHLYSIRFEWNGYGKVEWRMGTFGNNNSENDSLIHRFRPTGSISIGTPHLPIKLEINNGTTAATGSFFFTCRSFSTQGKFFPTTRTISASRLSSSISATPSPIISFRRKSLISNISNITIGNFDILSTGNFLWELRLNATLTGSSFGSISNIPDNETTLEADVAATAGVGGILLAAGIGQGSSGFHSDVVSETLPHFDMIKTQPISLFVRTLSGNDTVYSTFSMKEEW